MMHVKIGHLSVQQLEETDKKLVHADQFTLSSTHYDEMAQTIDNPAI